jgi:2-hydroxycyclohexanecarboxyl-CoA dehydrogenase
MASPEGVAVVTGAGSGIGPATARRHAAGGWRVAVADVHLDGARETLAQLAAGAEGRTVHVDVADPASCRAMVAEVEERLGAVHLLVNNAGWDAVAPFVETTPDLWDRLWAINLRGTMACTHAALPGMIARGGGRVLCVASDAGRVGSSGEVAYSATKGGVIAFVEALAREVARHGVLVNVVAPGPTRTPFLEEFTKGGDTDRILDAMVRATPLRRLADPEDVAGVIAFLASEDARFLTGQTVSVSGGLTML